MKQHSNRQYTSNNWNSHLWHRKDKHRFVKRIWSSISSVFVFDIHHKNRFRLIIFVFIVEILIYADSLHGPDVHVHFLFGPVKLKSKRRKKSNTGTASTIRLQSAHEIVFAKWRCSRQKKTKITIWNDIWSGSILWNRVAKTTRKDKPKTKGKCNRLKIDSNLVNLTCLNEIDEIDSQSAKEKEEEEKKNRIDTNNRLT